ncbi:MAG: hypothetical protein K2I18_06605 [Paramuribaculum sp.]|nr:hypothetical protein [Paramuribaculum sp.]
MTLTKISAILATAAVVAAAVACKSVDDDRIPPTPVRIEFPTVGSWQTYGVAGALDSRTFIKSERQPAGFPYSDMSATGFGGVILVCSFDNIPLAYDLSCPVEVRTNVRIAIDPETNNAHCGKCGSTYDIYRTGAPLSGPAADKGYALQRYRVVPGNTALSYMTIVR